MASYREAVTGLEQVCFSEKWSEGLLRSGLDSRLAVNLRMISGTFPWFP